MTFHINHRWGGCDPLPTAEAFEPLYAELAVPDVEHAEVSVVHESGWALSAYPGGRLVWENLDDFVAPRHLPAVGREKVLDLWRKLAAGDVAAIQGESWQEGQA
jgi:hypothetical protein